MAIPCAISTPKAGRYPELLRFDPHKQKTVKNPFSISGFGIFTGEEATLTLHPAEPNTGIVFKRADLPGNPELKAQLQSVVSTPRCTILGNKQFTIHTVEHILAALSALGIDNAFLELTGPEVPILDGSSMQFVEAILEEGMEQQEASKAYAELKTPFSWTKDDVHLIALPSKEYKISYMLHYPESQLLRAQYFSTPINPTSFIDELAPCRTFCFYEEIKPLIESGLIRGGGMDNAVIIKEDTVINNDGMRYAEEMARHKILDLIGDLSLMPISFHAHIIAIRSGHASNVAFAKGLYTHLQLERSL